MNHNEIGIEALNQGNIEKTAEAFTKAIEESPKDPVPYINFANLLSSINEFERALNFFQKAIELDHALVAAYYGAGNVYTLKEDFMKAKDYFEQALQAGMENSDLFYMLGQTLIKLERTEACDALSSACHRTE